MALLFRWARPALELTSGESIIVFGWKGFAGLCIYLAVLYSVTYFLLRPDGLPSPATQILTLGMYGLVILGLRLHRRYEPIADTDFRVERREMIFVLRWFGLLFVLAMLLTLIVGHPFLYVPIMANFAIWTPLGLLLTAVAFVADLRTRP